jgi:phospholipid/cholesterol/gamma-HCH transport system permease protein
LNPARLEFDAATATARAAGDWRVRDPDLARIAPLPEGAVRVLDGSGITALDTGGAWKLIASTVAQGDPGQLTLSGFGAPQRAILDLVIRHYGATRGAVGGRPPGLLAQFGRGALAVWRDLVGLLDFMGRLSVEWLALLRQPGRFRWRELGAQTQTIFVNAISLAVMMLFLLGVVFAYLMGVQAQKYGANIFVVDGVAMAVTRELSPVIVAILVAGRSGAAITAQIGTMKVTEEIDAIATLGLSPWLVLVMPRIIALLVALPLLVFLGDVAGIFGGLVIAEHQLDISPSMFVDRLDSVLEPKFVWVGLAKAPVFAAFIGLIACRMGFAARRDARSVGENTTSTVVQSIVAVIILNAIFAIVLDYLGI